MAGEVFGHYLLDRYATVTIGGAATLICRPCGATVCGIDEDDTLGVLADVALTHWLDKHFKEGT